MATLQFAPWRSDIDFSFYSSLVSRKIDYDKLDDAARKLVGRYEIQLSDEPERSVRMQILGDALTAQTVAPPRFRAEGTIKNTNTVEEFRNLDRSVIMEQAGRTVWEAILDGTIYSCPSLLSSFFAIFFADLKKYRFTYHFAFPALHYEEKWQPVDDLDDEAKLRLPANESQPLYDAVSTWRASEQDTRQHGFFLAKRVRRSALDRETRNQDPTPYESSDLRPQTPKTPNAEQLGFDWNVGPLWAYERGFFTDSSEEDRFICFIDPSTYPKNPGWMLRNLLILVRARWRLDHVQVLCYRDTHHRREKANSVLLRLRIPDASQIAVPPPVSKYTGWERNDTGKLTSRTVDLAHSMRPESLADQSVDLNLKLMKWRIAPSLDLDKIKNTKCLLLGAGTLGSYVSRNLLGWGVRKITFVDNAKVSFSNPVRQPLFNFEDCKNGGAEKAIRAAKALQEIYPGVDAQGHVMSVPMAGHPMTDEAKTRTEFDKLKQLIDEHDVVFLLMDTRESRWLPTVMGKAAGKIVLNAALGFDSYVVMRHGAKAPKMTAETGSNSQDAGVEVGCYFCNDVVAPADSQKDATLDQQCTVTRPGIAPIASATLVELLVSILQHPLSHRAPAPVPGASISNSSGRGPDDHPLGTTPHTIRGFLSSWQNMIISGQSYDCCSACSPAIVGKYEEQGWEFVKRAINERGYVEDVSGLAEVQRKAEAAEKELELFEDSDDEGDGEMGEIGGEGELL